MKNVIKNINKNVYKKKKPINWIGFLLMVSFTFVSGKLITIRKNPI